MRQGALPPGMPGMDGPAGGNGGHGTGQYL
jgi:hypothetical protein